MTLTRKKKTRISHGPRYECSGPDVLLKSGDENKGKRGGGPGRIDTTEVGGGGLTDDWPRTFCLGSTHQRLALTIYLGGETERENNYLGKGEKDQSPPPE